MKTNVELPAEPEQKREDPPAVPVEFPAPSGSSGRTGAKGPSPFQKAKTRGKRLKLFLWGDSGVGKTVTALRFPRPVVLDFEGGTDLYGDHFDFDVQKVTTADQAMEAVDWLQQNLHPYRTLVIDPVTVYWDALQRKWSDIFLLRNKKSAGHKHEFYDMQPKDWMTLKGEFREFMRRLIALDMNVIVTARQKVQYAEGEYMHAIGETFDGEKSLPYLFDTIIRLFREKDTFRGECLKDRSGRIPARLFDCSYSILEGFFGEETLNREARPVEYATDRQKKELVAYIARSGASPEQVAKRLAAYNATCLDELAREDAQTILEKFEAAATAPAFQTSTTKEE
jgi:hypothetical protein